MIGIRRAHHIAKQARVSVREETNGSKEARGLNTNPSATYPIEPDGRPVGPLRQLPSHLAQGSIDHAGRVEHATRTSVLELRSDERLRVRGWAAATAPEGVFEKLYFVIDDALWLPVAYGVRRRDLRTQRPNRLLECAGFDVSFAVRHIRPGSHSLTIVGTTAGRAQRLSACVRFSVLSALHETHDVAPQANARGRVRVLRDTLPQHRHDGRAPAAVRLGASLAIEGWALAEDTAVTPDETRLLLVGSEKTYRAEVQPRNEPEAGIGFGADAVRSGYFACLDCAELAPGHYEVWTEVRLRERWTSSPTGRRVEIMGKAPHWLPAALPLYRTALASSIDATLPSHLAYGEELSISGRITTSTEISGVFARFDDEQTYALTCSEIPSVESGAAVYPFTALLQPPLTLGEHVMEILALDANCSGIWRLAEHAFSLQQYELHSAAPAQM